MSTPASSPRQLARRRVPDALAFAALLVLGLAQCAWVYALKRSSTDYIVADREATAVDTRERMGAGTLRFADGMPGQAYLIVGWSPGGTDGVWMTGARAQLVLPLRDSLRGGFALQLCGKTFVARHYPERDFVIRLDETVVAQWHDTPDQPWTCHEAKVPAALAADGVVRVAIESPRYPSPEMARQGRDQRRLGMLLSELRVAPL